MYDIAHSDDRSDDHNAERALRPALKRGFRKKCPRCGAGPLLKSYLKLRDHCTVCGEDLSHARADDGPAYITILIVGHVVGVMMHLGFTTFRPEPMVLATFCIVGAVAMSLFLLPRIKGMLVAFQWARRMHGFRA